MKSVHSQQHGQTHDAVLHCDHCHVPASMQKTDSMHAASQSLTACSASSHFHDNAEWAFVSLREVVWCDCAQELGGPPVLHQNACHCCISNEGQHLRVEHNTRAVPDSPVNQQKGVVGHVWVVVKGC